MRSGLCRLCRPLAGRLDLLFLFFTLWLCPPPAHPSGGLWASPSVAADRTPGTPAHTATMLVPKRMSAPNAAHPFHTCPAIFCFSTAHGSHICGTWAAILL